MIEFKYTGKKQGKKISGSLFSENKEEALATLKKQFIVVKTIKALTQESTSKFDFFNKVSDKELFLFTKKVSTMIKAGLPLFESLELVLQQLEKGYFQTIIRIVLNDIKNGMSLSNALKKHPKVFDYSYFSMVEAGEVTGSLDTFLIKLTDSLEKTIKIKSNIKSALFYPIILVVVAVGITMFMLIKVVPVFEEMYANMNVELPSLTQSIVTAGHFVANGNNILIITSVIFIFISIYKRLLKNKKIRRKNDALLLKLPLFGKIIHQSSIAKIALLMSNLLSAGVNIVDVLKVTSSSSKNILFLEALKNVSIGVVAGKPLSKLFAKEEVFPSNFSQLLSVGERTGNVDKMLQSIANYYEEEFDAIVKGLATIIEPVMIVFVGGLVGVLMIALYLPIFSAGSLV